MTDTAPKVMRRVWALADKPERMEAMRLVTAECSWPDARSFWGEFWSVWTNSESLFMDEGAIEELIGHGLALGDPHSGLNEGEREALREMPERIRVWRGATATNQIGWSWTTDREKACWFAVRGYGSKERYLMTAEVKRQDVLAIIDRRDESEVVIDPANLIGTAIEDEWESESVGPLMFWLAQTGQLPDNPAVRAEMLMNTMHNRPSDLRLREWRSDLELCKWLRLKRGQYIHRLLELIDEKFGAERESSNEQHHA